MPDPVPDFSDEMLMRFADGELAPDLSARLESAMETDDELVARVGFFIETRAAAKAALKPLLDEPVPPALAASVEAMIAEKRARESRSANVVPFQAPAGSRRARASIILPLAASIAAIAGGIGGYFIAGANQPAGNAQAIAGHVGPAIGEALSTVASGSELQMPGSNDRFRAIATFRDENKSICREFEVDSPTSETVVSIACRADGTWQVRFAVVAPGDQTGYAPASSLETLDAYLTAIGAGAPMTPEEEVAALGEPG